MDEFERQLLDKTFGSYNEDALSKSNLPSCVKNLFRYRDAMGATTTDDGQPIFSCNGENFEYYQWSPAEIKKTLAPVLGKALLHISDEDIETVRLFMNHGFSVIPTFYGDNEKRLKASVSWFRFVGAIFDTKKHITLTICVGKGKDGVNNLTVYQEHGNESRKIGVFNDLDDVIDLFKLHDYVPVIQTDVTDSKFNYQLDVTKIKKIYPNGTLNNELETTKKLFTAAKEAFSEEHIDVPSHIGEFLEKCLEASGTTETH